MLAIIGKAEIGLTREALKQFKLLSTTGCVPPNAPPGHTDGWGIASYKNGSLTELKKSTHLAATDPQFTEASSCITSEMSDCVIAHLRKASVGDNKIVNTHPLVADNILLCHNGTIYNAHTISLKDQKMEGETDSERFLRYVIELRRSSSSLREAFIRATQLIHTKDYTAMNMFVCDGKSLLAFRDFAKNSDYYTLYQGTSPDAKTTVFCSEKLALSGVTWRLLKNQELIEIPLPISAS